jgi:signal transduction histidine kinase
VKLRTAFVLSLLAVLGVMAVPALFGVKHVRAVREIALDMRARTARAAFKVGRIQTGLERLDRYERSYVATGDPELAERTRSAAHVLVEDLDELRASGYARAVDRSGLPVEGIQALSELSILLMQSNLPEAATELVRSHLGPLIAQAGADAELLATAVDETTLARLENVDRITGRALTTTTASLLGALLIAGALTLLAARFLTRPLNHLSRSMTRVADGAFDPPESLPYDRRDEIGDLLRAFRSMALQLADLDRMKAEFVGMASHDLKTPVNVVSGYAELLSEEVAPQLETHHRDVLYALARQTRTLSTRLDQLLEISRIQAGGLRLGLEEINIRHFVSELERSYGALGARHGIQVTSTVEDSAPTFLIADPDALRQEVFDNLLENAMKFSPQGGRVSIRACGHGGTVSFEVADDGPAIPADAAPHVFDRYYRGRGKSGRLGAGLGLPIARAAVEAHGGTIEVDTGRDRGALFRVTLAIHPTVPSLYSEEAGA